MRLPFFKSLNGLRTIAAVMVIFAHFFTAERSFNSPLFFKIMQFGNSGVSLFFVLSGFVITRILINSVNSNSYFRTFYIRRAIRIFPLYYFALLSYYFLPFLFTGHNYIPPSLGQQIYYYSYLQNFALTFNWNAEGPHHFWSLGVEEHFYLLWPAIIYLIYRFRMGNLFFVSGFLIIFPLVLRYWFLSKGYQIDYFTFTRLDQLAMGGVLAILEYKKLLNFSYKWTYLVLLLIGGFFFVLCNPLDNFYQDLLKHSALGIFYFGIIGMCVIFEDRGWVTGFLKLPFMQYLGTISYGIYVWHALALQILKKFLVTNLIVIDLVLVLILTIAISSISYWILEKPFLNLKRFFRYG